MTASTIAPTDVNTAFLETRMSQIAAARTAREAMTADQLQRVADFDRRVQEGKLRDLGDGRFRVTDPGNWDDGEVLYQLQTEFGPLILPVTDLDTTRDGNAALYSAVPTWHGTGTVIPGGITDIEQVLKLAGLDFTVGIAPAEFRPCADGPYRVVPDTFHTFREDTGAPLGTVGKIYTPFQNIEAFRFLQDLVVNYNITWESAGALYGGTKVFISFRLPREIRIDAQGINDEILPFVVFLNSHHGKTKVITCITPWRPVCGNTERFALRDARARWGHTHTPNVHTKVYEARQELNMSMAYFDKFERDMNLLAQTPLDIDAFIATVKDVFEPPKAEDEASKHRDYLDKVARLVHRFEQNAAGLGFTAYAGQRAVTEDLDHRQLKPRGDLRGRLAAAHATRILDGEDDTPKTKLHRRLMTLVRR